MTHAEIKKLRTEIAILWGFNLKTNFFYLSCDEIAYIEKLRKAVGYKGDNKQGRSRARQFWYYLQDGFSKLNKY